MAKPSGCLTLISVIGFLFVFASCVAMQRPEAITTTPAPPPPAPTPPPPGWSASEHEGIYWRWCTDDPACSADRVIGDSSYVLAQVWCKDRPCGDIYARVNLVNDADVVVGWTNDTGYGDIGQKVQLTFHATQDDWKTARITELNVRP